MIKKFTIPILKIIISFGLIILLSYKLGFRNVVAQITSANINWFLAGMALFTVSNLLGSLQWHLLLKLKQIHLPFLKVLSIYHVGLFFNNFLVGYIGGDVIRVYDISKTNGNNTDAISSVFVDRLIGFSILTTMALVAALYWGKVFLSNTILFIILGIFLNWVFLFVIFFNKKLIKNFEWLIKLILPEKIKSKIREIYIGINTFKHHKIELLKVIVISIFTQSARIVVHYFAARSIGVNIDIIYFIIFVPIIALFSSLPISIGGIGIRESSGVALFSNFWSVQPDIVAFEFLSYLIGVISAFPGGIILAIRKEMNHLKLKGEIQNEI